MIRRTFDADRLNALANDPSIRPTIGGDPETPLDLTAAVNDRANVFLDGEHGAFACSWSAPGVFEVHTMILPEGRGKWAGDFARAGRNAMANLWGAKHLWTRVHPDAVNVKAFAIRAGMKPAGKHTLDLGAGPVTYDLFDWRP